MCNHYSITTNQEAIRALFRVVNRYVGNLAPISFAEYAPEPNPETKKKDVVWFALNDDRPLTCFAGIWTEFKGDRGTKSKPIPVRITSMASSRRRRMQLSSQSIPRRCRSSC
jgi:putative SOS response-associated peptidase YedK